VADLQRAGALIALVRDTGTGRLVNPGMADCVSYPLRSPIDRDNIVDAAVAMLRIHEAAGAVRAYVVGFPGVAWSQGLEPGRLRPNLARALQARRLTLNSVHQMGTCRLGSDPRTSVATPEGQVHNTQGLWIGDTSAFPTATGVNPMLTLLALSRRTARHIRASF
jgi:choline dehydrogenase-like flavoprotein